MRYVAITVWLVMAVLGLGQESVIDAPPVDERQAALDRAVSWFGSLAEQDDEGWFYPPKRNRKKVGSEAYTNYYSWVTVTLERGVYERRDTGEKDVYRNRKVGDSVDAVGVREKVTRRTHEKKKIGTKKVQVERLRRDPDGDVAKVHHKPIYGSGGPDQWKSDQLGHNALVIYALIRAGVDPGDWLVTQPLDSLSGIYSTYGYPDHTWDLAWSVAAFASVPDESRRQQASEMAAKLAAGMVRGGPGAGLWGPVSVDTRVLAGLLKKQLELSAAFIESKSRHARDDSKSSESRLAAAERALRQVGRDIRRAYTRHGWDYTRYPRLQAEEGGDAVFVGILPQYIYNQTSTDMESTALALYALGVAKRNGVLPETVFSPLAPKQSISRLRRTPSKPRGERIQDLAAISIRAIAGKQNRDGSFSELNTHQSISDFNALGGFEGVPAKAASFKELKSPVTLCSTAQGLSCLVSCSHLAGPSGLKAIDRNFAAAKEYLNVNMAEALSDKPEELGGRYAAYDLVFALSAAGPRTSGHLAELRGELDTHLFETQQIDGSWVLPGRRLPALTSSFRERLAVLPLGVFGKQKPRTTNFTSRANAHVPYDRLNKRLNTQLVTNHAMKPGLVPTAYAMLALSGVQAASVDTDSSPGATEVRTWTSTTGKTLRGRYVGHAEDKVMILGENGKKYAVPLRKLSKADQEHIAGQQVSPAGHSAGESLGEGLER